MSTRPTVDAPCVFTLVARVFCILLPFSGIVGAKVYDRCELAQVLHQRHQLDLHEVATWTCIAQHSSGFNTEAYAGGLDGGSHGLFQISDVYWCSPPGKGFACNLPCERLRDADLTDDLRCLRTIYDEHQRLSGDGYNAWNAYQQFCRHDVESYVADCFPNQSIAPVAQQTTTHSTFASAQASYYISNDLEVHTNSISDSYSTHKRGKIYDRCELAQELYYKHKMPMEQIPTWVCIAQHESKFDTSAVGRLNADGSADHGLFQISDLYWCSHDRYSGGKACGLQCTKLLDNDISDDVRCIKRIHGEHTRISGDGFTAWTVYKRNCRNQQYSFVSKCFQEQPLQQAAKQTHVQTSHSHTFPSFQAPQVSAQSQSQANPYLKYNGVPPKSTQTLQKHQQHKYTSPKIVTQTHNTQTHKGKVYKRCELAQELYFKHKFPIQDIATWVCIAQHESNYNTAAVGRLNGDGSADHGLFQISDLYWCAHEEYGGKACNIPCAKLLDSDISDDVRCIRIIHEEHTRISGDGFTAWTVYNHHCRNQKLDRVASCFPQEELNKPEPMQPAVETNKVVHGETGVAVGKGKIYKKCELAQELYFKHKMPMKDVPTWVCIAQHESSFNTAAVGRLNADGSADHGLFQISDLYWCSHEDADDKACHISCNKLLDNDITDDVRCVKTIYEEHTRLSGDGFTAWTVYNRNCRNQQLERISACFNSELLQQAQEANEIAQREHTTYLTQSSNINQITTLPKKIKHKDELNHPFVNNPFLNQFSAVKFVPTTMKPKTTAKPVTHYNVAAKKTNFVNNPFLNQFIQTQQKPHSVAKAPQTVTNTKFIPAVLTSASYAANPFLSKYQPSETKQQTLKPIIIQQHQKQNYHSNPFLSKYTGQSASFSLTETINQQTFNVAKQREHSQLTLTKPQTPQKQNFYSNPFLSQYIDQSSSLIVHKQASSANPPRSQIVAQYQNNPFLQQISAASHSTTIKTSSHTQQQNIRPTPSNTEKSKLHVYPTKPYVNSEVFRTTPVKIPAALTEFKPGVETKFSTTVTSGRPITTITQKPQTQTTKQYYTNLLITTTTRRPTTPVESATKRPSTTWKWQQPQQVQPVKAAATQKPTTRVPATEAKPFVSTTRPPQTTARTKLKNNQKSVTNKGSTPQTSTTTTTRKSQTTKNPGLYQEKKTTWNTLATATTKRPTPTTKTTQNVGIQKPSTTTTTRKPTTTQNAGLRKPTTVATTRKPTTKQSVTKPTSKSTNDKTANLIATTTTTRKPGTTVRAPLTQKTTAAARTTTKRPTTTTQRATKYTTTNSKLNYKYSSTKVQQQHFATTSTRKPTTTVRTPLKQNTFAATKPPANTQPSRRPATASLNNFSTTKVPYTTKKITTTTTFTQYTKSSTQKPKVTTTKQTALTNTISNTRGTTRKPAFYVANTMNEKPNVLKNQVHTTPTKAALTVTTAKYREDPFSHPFFDKYKEQFKVFDTTTTRKPTSAVTQKSVQAHFGEESEYYKQFRNHASGSAKTVYAYAFGQNGTLAGHYGR